MNQYIRRICKNGEFPGVAININTSETAKISIIMARLDLEQPELQFVIKDLSVCGLQNVSAMFWTTDWNEQKGVTIARISELPYISGVVPIIEKNDKTQDILFHGVLTNNEAIKNAHHKELFLIYEDPVGIPEFELLLLPVLAIALLFVVLRKRKNKVTS